MRHSLHALSLLCCSAAHAYECLPEGYDVLVSHPVSRWAVDQSVNLARGIISKADRGYPLTSICFDLGQLQQLMTVAYIGGFDTGFRDPEWGMDTDAQRACIFDFLDAFTTFEACDAEPGKDMRTAIRANMAELAAKGEVLLEHGR